MANKGYPIRAQEVKEFHYYDDVDSSWRAHHHTIGEGPDQAAAGNHRHRLSHLTRYREGIVTCTSGVLQDIGFGSTLFPDKGDGISHNNTTGIFTIHRKMIVAISCTITWDTASDTGRRELFFYHNGTRRKRDGFGNNGTLTAGTTNQLSFTWPFDKDDTFQFRIIQTSGANLNATGSADGSSLNVQVTELGKQYT